MKVNVVCELKLCFAEVEQAKRLQKILEPENKQLVSGKISGKVVENCLQVKYSAITNLKGIRTTLDLLLQDSILALKLEEV